MHRIELLLDNFIKSLDALHPIEFIAKIQITY